MANTDRAAASRFDPREEPIAQRARFVRERYQGTLMAPYRHFRKNTYYNSFIAGGTYEGAIQGCPWRCQNCWSRWGYVHEPTGQELEPRQVVDKLLAGMERHGKAGGRITGGETAYWWDHVGELTRLFIEETANEHIVIKGLTPRKGVPMMIVLETSGGLRFQQRPAELEEALGEEAARVVISVGLKATNPQLLDELTGLGPEAAAAAYRRQMELLENLVAAEHLQYVVTLIDRFTHQEEFEQLRDRLETDRGGVDVFPFRTYSGIKGDGRRG